MTLLTVVKDVCAFVGVHEPTTLFGNVTDPRTQLELLAVANEMAQRIAGEGREWRALKTRATFAGDGITEAFPLPDNYKRMLLTSQVWRSTSAIQPMLFISDSDEWVQRRLRGYNHAFGEWMLQGDAIHIWPIMAAHTSSSWQNGRTYNVGDLAVDSTTGAVPPYVWQAAVQHTAAATGTFTDDRTANPTFWVLPTQALDAITATFNYMDKNCIKLASGGRGDTFMGDTDNFVLDERLLKLGMIWQWKALKGSPYAEDMATFMDALTRAGGADKPSPILIGRLPVLNTAVTYPYATPGPANWNWPLS
jgi:hypothetical protein